MNFFEDLFLRYMAQEKPDMVIEFCEEKGRIKQIEDQIIRMPKLAFNYANIVIKDRWEEAEKYIVSDETAAIGYAQLVLRGRFPLYESKIIKDKDKILTYCTRIKKRFIEAEPLLAKSSIFHMFQYAGNVIGGRFEMAEPKIITKPKWIYDYACVLRKKPSEEMHNAMTLFSFQEPNNKIIKKYFLEFGP